MAKARRMTLVPEEDIFKAEERKVNTSPLVKSLANMDLEIKAILEDTTMPPDRKIQLYDSIMNRYRNILNQYRSKIPYVRVLPTPKRKKKRKRPKRPAFATPIGTAVLPIPAPADVEEEEEEEEKEEEEAPFLFPTPPDTPLQLPSTSDTTPFIPSYHGKEKRGRKLLPSPVMTRWKQKKEKTSPIITRAKGKQMGTGLNRAMLRRYWVSY